MFRLLSILCLLLPILGLIAFYTLGERKIMALVQRRRGPNVVGFWGLLQPIVDGIKLLLKEILIPQRASYFLFLLSPILSFSLSLTVWLFLPNISWFFVLDSNIGLLLVFAFGSLEIFGVVGGGWSSNSSYAFLGSLRSVAQLISYEIAFGFIILSVCIWSESLNIYDIMLAQQNLPNIVPLFPLAVIFFITALAETNRAPFDLPEAEAELVAGYNVEYSGIPFALFFLAEYSNMFLLSILFVVLFWGSLGFTFISIFYFVLKIVVVASFFIFVRATLPRVRYDQLMFLGWQIFLPFTLSFFFFECSLIFLDDLFFFGRILDISMYITFL